MLNALTDYSPSLNGLMQQPQGSSVDPAGIGTQLPAAVPGIQSSEGQFTRDSAEQQQERQQNAPFAHQRSQALTGFLGLNRTGAQSAEGAQDEEQSGAALPGEEQRTDPLEPQAAGEEDKDTDAAVNELSEEEQAEVDQMKERDQEVQVHEQAHKSAGGSLASAPSYSYETGPDGKRYITDGEVQIDTSKGSDPQETIDKMQQVQRAALAPAQPSSQDRKVAAEASRMEAEARAELAQQNRPSGSRESQKSEQSAETALPDPDSSKQSTFEEPQQP